MQGIVYRLFSLMLMISPFSSAFAGTVELHATDHTCGHSRCGKPPCLSQKWLEDGRLQVHAETLVPITQKVDVKSAGYSLEGDRLQLNYGAIKRERSPDPSGAPPPACLMTVTLNYTISGLPQAQYHVSVREDYFYGLYWWLIGILVMVVALVFRQVNKRREKRSASIERA